MGLLRGVARTAVVAGTATAVSNRVSRRQAGRWAQQEQQEQQPVAAQAPPPAQPATPSMEDKLAQLKELGSRKDMRGEGLPLLVDLVERGIIRILDLTFVTKDDDGSVTVVDLADEDADGWLDLAIFQGASSGVIGEDEISEAASVLEPGTSAGILIYENTWAAPFAGALRRNGAQIVASGRIPVTEVLEALETAGSSS